MIIVSDRLRRVLSGECLLALLLFALATLALVFAPAGARARELIEVTDVAGRTVKVKRGVQRAVLAEGRMIYATAILDRDDPFARIAAWSDDLIKFDPDAWRKYDAKFPKAKQVPAIGNLYTSDFNVETTLKVDADVVVANLGNYFKVAETGLIQKLERAGVPLVFIDFREQPSQNTVPSMLLLGKIFDREREAQAFVDFLTAETRKVFARVWRLKDGDRPLVFVERAAGFNPNLCCGTFGPENHGAFVAEAGGFNWGSRFFGGAGGDVNPEKVFVDDPPYYLMTGANWSVSTPNTTAVLLGYDARPADVQARMKALMARPGFPNLAAARSKGHVMAIYHHFYTSPYAFVAVQAIAKWLHPKEFADIDAERTLAELHRRFLPIEPSGVFWAVME